jgi:hypothetical protein
MSWLRYRPLEAEIGRIERAHGLPDMGRKYFRRGEVRAIVGTESSGRWTLSVSCAARYPTWDEVADARYDLVPPDVTMVMPLPPPQDYLNESAFVFNLVEARDLEVVIDRGHGQRRTHEAEGRWPDPIAYARALSSKRIAYARALSSKRIAYARALSSKRPE